jgi:hypothetical protein
MPSVPRQLGIFAAVLAVLFAVGYAVGQIIDTSHGGGGHGSHGGGSMRMAEHGGGHEVSAAAHGLGATENGLSLEVETPMLRRGHVSPIVFSIRDADGDPVRDYDVEHAKRMHLILARRDLAVFRHLHPRFVGGRWVTHARLDAPGPYRLFADFSHGGTKTTLAGDVRVPGTADLLALPEAQPATRTGDGYDVRIDDRARRAGESARLSFTVRKDGRLVRTEPYLGAAGHLVALRQGDLAFLHVHPAMSTLGFDAAFPSVDRYRLFLQFRDAGSVHTAAFTYDVSVAAVGP